MTRTEIRIVTFGLLLAVFSGVSQHGYAHETAEPTWANRFDTVRYRSLEGSDQHFSVHENQLTVHAAAVKFHVSEGYMTCVVMRESGWNEYAFNPSSAASGLFQHLRRYWYGRVAAYHSAMRNRPRLQIRLGASPFNARANTLVSARLIALGQTYHWGPC